MPKLTVKSLRSAAATRKGRRAAHGSVAHVHFEVITKMGNRATITGNPAMPETTMRAMAHMIDALSEAIVAGKIKCH